MQIVYGKNQKEDDFFIKKNCKCCKKTFVSLYRQQIYCSEECRKAFSKKNNKKELPKKDTLCWDCQNACGKCSWSKDLTPVDGWNAKPTKIKSHGAYDDSYLVIECPEFIRDQRREVFKI